jgi:5-formyltetrahydrofolate cyclo-ligase
MKSKDQIRKKVWSEMEKRRVARFPGAAGRIPNFTGAEACAKMLAETKMWKSARVLKVNPDAPQRAIRQQALSEGKIIYMAVPRLRSVKPFIELDPAKLQCSAYAASSIKGASQFGKPVGLSELKNIDLVVCGSVAVNRCGARVGKGGGYSDLEFALLVEANKIGVKTPIVTAVHPLQIINEQIPTEKHDIPLDAILTPLAVIEVNPRLRRPRGILWRSLPQEKIDEIPVLQNRLPYRARR